MGKTKGKGKEQFPVHLLRYPAELVKDANACNLIMSDEYLFGTYFTAMLQGAQNDSGIEDVMVILERHLGDHFKADELEDITSVKKRDQERMMKIVDHLRSQFGEQVTSTYVRDFFIATATYRGILSMEKDFTRCISLFGAIIQSMMEAFLAQAPVGGVSSITENLNRLTKVMSLTQSEGRLLEVSLLFAIDTRFMIFRDFLHQLVRNQASYTNCIKVMLALGGNVFDREVDAALLPQTSKPLALGMISYDQHFKRIGRLSEFWSFAITTMAKTESEFYARFVEPLKDKKKNFAGALAKLNEHDEELLKEFVRHTVTGEIDADYSVQRAKVRKLMEKIVAVSENSYVDDIDAFSLNVFLYGSKKLDKLGYLSKLFEEEGVEGYQVRTRDAKDHDIPAICYAAQQIVGKRVNVAKDDKVMLVVENTESALSKSFSKPAWFLDAFGDAGLKTKEKDELDSDELILTKNPVPTVWLASSTAYMEQENLGRFLFHCELRGGSRKDRRDEVDRIIKALGFSEQAVQTLSRYVELSPEQIKSAARMIELVDQQGAAGESNLLHLISNSQRVLDREKMEDLRDSVTKYNLDFLNIRGNVNVPQLIKALQRTKQGTICFYGMPGTGKTQLAEYIAMQCDQPLLIKPASELLSMWLGETEKKIAEAFDEAKSEGAIFLLDEGDSFLQDRSRAQHSWQVTQVNELLQKMERFPGIFILATNLFEGIDAAAVRRFTFKLEFLALRQEQRVKMLCSELDWDFEKLSEAERGKIDVEVGTIQYLTPGDFATVKRQANILGEKLTFEDWIERLNSESRAKLAGLRRNDNYGQSNNFAGVKPREQR